MPDVTPSSPNSFEHFHRHAVQQLKLVVAQSELDRATASEVAAHGILLEELTKTMRAIVESLDVARPDPEQMLSKTTAALNRVERFRFVVENLLEAVKKDDSLNNAVTRYSQLGLIEVSTSNLVEEKRSSPFFSNNNAGRFLRRLLDAVRSTAVALMTIIVNALKAVPKFVAIKPKPSIGFAGVFPTFSLEFELEADSMTLDELFSALLKGVL